MNGISRIKNPPGGGVESRGQVERQGVGVGCR